MEPASGNEDGGPHGNYGSVTPRSANCRQPEKTAPSLLSVETLGFTLVSRKDCSSLGTRCAPLRSKLSEFGTRTGAIIAARVVLAFTDQRFGGRRVWWICPQCPRRVRYLYGGRAYTSQAYAIACSECMRIVHASEHEDQGARWRRAIAKIEHRLGGDPRKLIPPKGNARRTFDRLAQRHARYVAKITAHAQERLRRKLSNRPWPTDPAELLALREACGLLESAA